MRAGRQSTAVRALVAGVVVLGFTLGVVVACGPGDLSDLTSGRRDGGEDSGKPCRSAVAPDRPEDAYEPGGSGLVFAADDLRVENADAPDGALAPPKGLDLDQSCGCEEKTPSCVPIIEGGVPSCDDEQGRDNEAARQLATLAAFYPDFRPTYLRSRIWEGAFSFVFRLEKWNGKANDSEVAVGVMPAVGLTRPAVGQARPLPAWDGEDSWDIDPGALSGGDKLLGADCNKPGTNCIPLALDTTAYVRDFTLVAHFRAAQLNINSGGGSFKLPFTDATLIARISGSAPDYVLAGEMVGRFPSDRLLSLAATASLSGESLCNTEGYEVFKLELCRAADIALDPADDNKGKPCNALSAAMAFTAKPARIGQVRAAGEQPSQCPNFQDTCPRGD